jgi:hypothetical protein
VKPTTSQSTRARSRSKRRIADNNPEAQISLIFSSENITSQGKFHHKDPEPANSKENRTEQEISKDRGAYLGDENDCESKFQATESGPNPPGHFPSFSSDTATSYAKGARAPPVS